MSPPPEPSPDQLDTLRELLEVRLAVVTGKGGVGKTTIAASLARLAAAAGKRVLLAEVGVEPSAPSPVRELLTGAPQGATTEPAPLLPGIDAVLLTPDAGHRAFLRDVLPLGFLADRALKTEVLRRFLGAAPAFAELGVLYRGLQLLRTGRWDLLVLDAPATGHVLAFASLPEVVLRIVPGGPIGRAVKEGLALLNDPKRTRVLVTTLPESLPVREALELMKGLERSRVAVHGVVANLVPEDPFDPYEHDALKHVLQPGGDEAAVLGGRSLGRLRRAREALDRLRESAGRALFTVREQPSVRGPGLVDKVASELEGPKR